MKYIKTITTLLFFIMISATTSAEIKFRSTSTMRPTYKSRTYIPRFDIEATKHNNYIEHSTLNQNYRPASYLTNETHQGRKNHHYQNISNSAQTSYYHRYTTTSTSTQNVSFHGPTTIKAYNPANNQPFNEANNTIAVGPTQYSFGPPAEGPIGDVIFPLLIFIGIYILKLKYSCNK